MKKLYIIFIISILFLSLSGCSSKQTNKQYISSSSTIRAIGRSNYGELTIVSKDKENVEQLGADSCFGKASDYSFTGDYYVIFAAKDGNKIIIAALNKQKIIQPENSIIELNKLTMSNADIFYFIPEYSGSNDVSIRFFAITKEGKSFVFNIEDNKAQQFGDVNALSDSTAVLSTTSKMYSPPEIVGKDSIALTAVYDIGGDQNLKIYKVVFRVDIKNKLLKYVSKEEIKS